MELLNNGADVKNGTPKETTKPTNENGAIKKEIAQPVKSLNGKTETEKAKPEAAPQEQPKPALAQPEPAKPGLSLDAKLKLVSDLHRRSVQRVNLITRIKQLEAFEVALASENDELEDNPYQGCKIIIRDDKGRDFTTNTPGLIRMVSQFIFTACNEKLAEIEATINFPNA